MASQRSRVFQAFKLSGLTLEAPAARYLLDVFKLHTPDQLEVALEAVLAAVKTLVLSSSVVPLSAIQEASKALESSCMGDEIDDVMLIGAAECPNLECAAPASLNPNLNPSPHKRLNSTTYDANLAGTTVGARLSSKHSPATRACCRAPA
jgi:hypothetical protein